MLYYKQKPAKLGSQGKILFKPWRLSQHYIKVKALGYVLGSPMLLCDKESEKQFFSLHIEQGNFNKMENFT